MAKKRKPKRYQILISFPNETTPERRTVIIESEREVAIGDVIPMGSRRGMGRVVTCVEITESNNGH
jgi:hypothetical protein